MPVILATQEAEIMSITVGSQPGQIILQILSRKIHHTHKHKKKGVGERFKV
jgi:hypothetical protein